MNTLIHMKITLDKLLLNLEYIPVIVEIKLYLNITT